MNPLPRAVVFDMDGLLFDSEALYRDGFVCAAAELRYRFTAQDFLKLVGRPWSTNRIALQEQIGPDENVDTFRSAWMRHYETKRACLRLKPGALELLARLDELRLPRAICTSSTHADVEVNLRLHGLINRFNVIVASGDYAKGKPAPDPFIRAAERLDVASAACLALEDSFNGIRSAAAAGMQTIMVPDLLQPSDEIRQLCEFVALDLHEVCDLLGGGCRKPAAGGRTNALGS